MTSQAELFDDVEEPTQLYRTVSRAAVFSLILCFLGIFALLTPALVILPAAAAGCGLLALRNIRRYPEELIGRIPAYLGLAIGLTLTIVSVTMHAYDAMMEVPEGYEPISFVELQPSRDRPDLPISPRALELNNRRVFIKGYVHPGVAGQGNIRHFVLVPDMKTCCFGGQPKLTDMVEVTLKPPLAIRYSTFRRGLGGVLRVSWERRNIGGIQGGFYKLEADCVK